MARDNHYSSCAAVAVRAFTITYVILVLCQGSASLFGQERRNENAPTLEELHRLRDQEAWQQLIEATALIRDPNPEVRLLRGIALAKSGQLSEAETELKDTLRETGEAGPEILVELAGVHFKQKRFRESRSALHRAMSLGQTDPYLLDFLASLYYLDGNLEAALKYWNRVGKPYVQDLRVEPDDSLGPVLLDRALAVSPASELSLQALRLTEVRLAMLGVFARRHYALSARQDGLFDLTIYTVPKTDLRDGSPVRSLLLAARELPFSTLNADVRNINRSALNWSSSLRWKSGNRQVTSALTAPVGRNPNLLYRVGLTARDEDWNLRAWRHASGPMSMSLVEAEASVTSIATDRWTWSTGITASHRRLPDTAPGSLQAEPGLASGSVVGSRWRTRYALLELPERRLNISAHGLWELSRFWHSEATLFTVGMAGIETLWEAQKNNALLVSLEARTGRSAGVVPFDRLFRLGVDLDTDLLLRGHAGTSKGLKGNSPMGTGYILANLDGQKRLYSNGLLSFSAGPFLDSGKILHSKSDSARQWMWDTGVEGRVAVLGLFRIAVSYGVDVHSGDRVLFCRVINR